MAQSAFMKENTNRIDQHTDYFSELKALYICRCFTGCAYCDDIRGLIESIRVVLMGTL